MACPPHPVPSTTILSFLVAVSSGGSSWPSEERGRFILAAGMKARVACMKTSSMVSIVRSTNARMSSGLTCKHDIYGVYFFIF